ncbi:MAG: response regulator transcription factor [Gordonia sp. (in: high G+C Gram-positive bacteria)]|uniref:response regulator transcription factor n=1 Tax=Gordonia sp. (in: high G+C Gram-positive bacteria) TaxID=84139 RepID=UPI003C73429C
MIRVLIVDDQRLVRAGLRMLCESTDDLDVVGEAADGAEAIRAVIALTPDVVLMDLRMPGLDGVAATTQITRRPDAPKVLVLTTFGDDDHLYPALAAGAAGFLVKDTDPADLLDAIRRVADGDLPFTPDLLRRLVDRAVDPATASSPPEPVALTDRESQILALVGDGLTNPEIAERLHLGVSTVKSHIGNLMDKTDCDNRARLAVYAYRRGQSGQ